jgi:hypothetical protein
MLDPQCNHRKLSRALTIPKRPAGKDREENRKIAKKEKERLAAMDKLVGEQLPVPSTNFSPPVALAPD